MKINDHMLNDLRPSDTEQRKVRDDLLPNFGVIIGKRTKMVFVMYGKTRTTKTLGTDPEKSLKDAREEARRYLARNPSEKRVTGLVALSEAFLVNCEARLRPNSVEAYKTILKHAPDTEIEKASKLTVIDTCGLSAIFKLVVA